MESHLKLVKGRVEMHGNGEATRVNASVLTDKSSLKRAQKLTHNTNRGLDILP